MFALKKYRGVMFDSTQNWCKISRKTNLCFFKMTWRIWQIFVYRMKNSDFILECKIVELNQNKNSRQPDRPDAVRKLYLETNQEFN